MKGRINSFQSLGTVDGPGVRTVVFMQGCNLRCPYCHNPDTWDKSKGEEVDTDDLIKKILRYRNYFGKEGGVTVSGGEPLLQAEFVTELFTKLKNFNISTALDTSGTIIDKNVLKLLDVTDIVLLDIKFSDSIKYEKYIRVKLEKVLEFLNICNEKNVKVIIRQVVTPQINDTIEDIVELKKIVDLYPCIIKTELLPFRKLCLEKYQNLNINFPFGDKQQMDEKILEELQNVIK